MIGFRTLKKRKFLAFTTRSIHKLYPEHIPLTNLQKAILTVGSGMGAIIDPLRDDLVADFGETTGKRALKFMYDKMSLDNEGYEILKNKPILNSNHVDYDSLAKLPVNTLGYHYKRFYVDNGVSPDTRKPVKFVDDPDLAYVMQRYRELHDLVHTILRQPTTIKGEVVIKAFEGVQTQLPLCLLGGVFGTVKLTPFEALEYVKRDLPWAIQCARQSKFLMSVYFEKRFEQDIDELREELNIRLMSV